MIGYGTSLPLRRRVGWSPRQVPGLIGYWDAADSLTTHGPDSRALIGEPVVHVPDRSPLGNALIQPDGNRQPLLAYFNGIDASAGYAWDFNGSNSQLISDLITGISGNAEISIYFTAKARTVSGDRCPFSFGNIGGALQSLLIFAAANGYYDVKYISNDYKTTQANTLDPYVFAYRKAAGPIDTTTEMTLNGVVAGDRGGSSIATPNWASDSFFTLGNNRHDAPSQPWDGLIGTILIFLRRLLDVEHAQVLGWLGRGYGL